MYNRYIPQPDGTYRRSKVPDQKPHRPPPPPPAQTCPPASAPEMPGRESCPPPKPPHRPDPPQPPCQKDGGIFSFFRQLLPRELDTSDLLIILLLLLMAGDCEEDRNNALLTLALYFFM